MNIDKLNIGYQVALGIALLHLAVVLILMFSSLSGTQSGWVLILLFWLDFFLEPVRNALPYPPNFAVSLALILLINGVLGSLIWSAIPAAIGYFIDYQKKNSLRE